MKIHFTRPWTYIPSVLLMLAVGCSSMQIQTGQDPQANLAQYHTYAWKPQPAPAPGQRPPSLLDQTVKASVDRELAGKGLTAVQDRTPDLLVNYLAATGTAYEFNSGPFAGPAYSGNTYAYRQGSLTLQLIDPRNNRIVWQGTAADVISDAGASQQQIAEAVRELMQRCPLA